MKTIVGSVTLAVLIAMLVILALHIYHVGFAVEADVRVITYWGGV